jgi:1-acyl-sn-glycerol-3-phosphate acyltransferase
MPWLRKARRLAALWPHLLLGACLAAALLRHSPPDAQGRRAAVVSWWNRRLCRILAVRLTVQGCLPQAPVFIVANHVSWLDIPVLASILPCTFVAKTEVRGWPLVGWLAARAGALFVERGNGESAARTLHGMIAHLRAGTSVALFPEGTTTNGASVRRFRPRLLAAAVRADVPIQPIAVIYGSGESPHPLVPFIGDDAFVPHLLRLIGSERIEAQVSLLPAYAARGCSERALADRAEAEIRAAIAPPRAGAPQAGRNHAPDGSSAPRCLRPRKTPSRGARIVRG